MKKTSSTMIAFFILVGFMAVGQAQTSGGRRLIATIPFDFNVADKAMPAGEYTVTQINPSSDHAVLQLRSKDGGVLIQMIRSSGNAHDAARLVFLRYGNQYFFAEAWVDGQKDGLKAPKSRAERALQRELASIKAKTERVALRTQ